MRTSPTRRAWIDGFALIAPSAPTQRPAPALLPPNERRRASDGVLLALKAAEDAVAMSGHAAAALPSVFTSAHGDLGIVDALARTLAREPLALSPTRFHHSVHNAASGYWSIASGSPEASTALAAYDTSFAAGLLEALVQLACDGRPLLLAGADTEATGPLASVNTSRGLLGVALVLAPAASAASRFVLDWALAAAPAPAAPAPGANALADALPLFERLAQGDSAALALPLGPALHLALALSARPAPLRGAG
jgi:hypothetical protein